MGGKRPRVLPARFFTPTPTLPHLSGRENTKRSVAAYLPQVKAELTFEPIGFGMWADRPEMQDAARWVADLREREWTR